MKKNTIITIGRQFSSGGSQIGQKLAEKLEIPYYDKIIMEHAAETQGFAKEFVDEMEEKHSNSFLYSLSAYSYDAPMVSTTPVSPALQILLAQFDFIRKAAAEGPCVIIGRCADYVLKNNPDLLNVFIYADLEDRVKNTMERYSLPKDSAEKMVRKTEKLRENYYNFYTDRKWGELSHYDIAVNASTFSIDDAVEIIYRAYLAKK